MKQNKKDFYHEYNIFTINNIHDDRNFTDWLCDELEKARNSQVDKKSLKQPSINKHKKISKSF